MQERCVESGETKPLFLGVSSQSPRTALRASTFPSWCSALQWRTELPHPHLSRLQFIASILLPLTPFHLFKLGRKTGKEEREKDAWNKLSTEKAAATLVCCWHIQGFLGPFQIPPTAYSWVIEKPVYSLQVHVSTVDAVIYFALSLCNELYSPFPPNPLKWFT